MNAEAEKRIIENKEHTYTPHRQREVFERRQTAATTKCYTAM